MRSTKIIVLLAKVLALSSTAAQSSRTEFRTLSVPGIGIWISVSIFRQDTINQPAAIRQSTPSAWSWMDGSIEPKTPAATVSR